MDLTWHTTTAIKNHKIHRLRLPKKGCGKHPKTQPTTAVPMHLTSLSDPCGHHQSTQHAKIYKHQHNQPIINQSKKWTSILSVPCFLTSSPSLPGNFLPSSCCKACRGGSWQFCGMGVEAAQTPKNESKKPTFRKFGTSWKNLTSVVFRKSWWYRDSHDSLSSRKGVVMLSWHPNSNFEGLLLSCVPGLYHLHSDASMTLGSAFQCWGIWSPARKWRPWKTRGQRRQWQ